MLPFLLDNTDATLPYQAPGSLPRPPTPVRASPSPLLDNDGYAPPSADTPPPLPSPVLDYGTAGFTSPPYKPALNTSLPPSPLDRRFPSFDFATGLFLGAQFLATGTPPAISPPPEARISPVESSLEPAFSPPLKPVSGRSVVDSPRRSVSMLPPVVVSSARPRVSFDGQFILSQFSLLLMSFR